MINGRNRTNEFTENFCKEWDATAQLVLRAMKASGKAIPIVPEEVNKYTKWAVSKSNAK